MSIKEKFYKNGKLLNGHHTVRSDKIKLVGNFKNGKLNGRAKGSYKYGKGKMWKCDGIWKNNNLHGKGKCKFSQKSQKGAQYHYGLWENDKLIKGTMVLPYYSQKTRKMEKETRIGSFKNEKLNGKCIRKWRNGIYKGSCKNNNFHGKGTFTINDKAYKGLWSGTDDDPILNGSRNWNH